MMYINGVDYSTIFPGKLQFLDYELTNPSYNRFITTTDGDRKIVNRRSSIGITNIVVRIAMYDNKENSYIMASKLVSMLGDAYVNFGGDLTYRVNVATDGAFELLTEELFLYSLQLQVLDKLGEAVVVETTSASPIVLANNGTYKTPIRIEVTPPTAMSSFSVYGFGKHTSTSPLVVTNPIELKKTVIDGDLCVVLQETTGGYVNKFLDTNILSFPEIPVGETTLIFSPSNLAVKISYNPRYI